MGTNMQRSENSDTQSNVAVLNSDKIPPEDKASPNETKGVRTYSQEEVSKMQSTFRTQLRDRDTENSTLMGQVKELGISNDSLKEQVGLLNKELDDSIQDEDTKALRTRLIKRETAFSDEKATFKKDKTEWEAVTAKDADAQIKEKAEKIAAKFGLDVDALLEQGLENMYEYAVDNFNPKAQPQVEPEQVEGKDEMLPKPQPTNQSVVGRDTSTMSADDKLVSGFRKLKN